jgi:Pex2 / Pex12 amino terminal region
MIIANEIDSSEINALSEQISSSFEIMFGGRASVTYLKETKFLSSFLYNILSIYQDASTPGQDFTGLRLVQVRSPTKQGLLPAEALNASSLLSVLDRIRSMWGQHRRNVYTPLRRELSNSMLLSALVSCIPYLNSRKTTIYATLAELYTALCADETAAVTSSSNIDQIPYATESISSRSHAPTPQLLPEDVIPSSSGLVSNYIGADIMPIETAGTVEGSSNPTAISSIKKISITQRVFRAAIRTFLTASPSPESASIFGFLQTVHLFQFLRSGRWVSADSHVIKL